ncbi:MAG TPA: zinc ribbon domain-containing protein [Ktedonobacteraceae bacterium]|nr:zinc ribbon domain-containing protein [Ktedonobacteraceae bacterium]
MAQTPPRFCPGCGAPTAVGQRFCANCGQEITPALLAQHISQRTSQAPQPTWAKPIPAATYPRAREMRRPGRAGFVFVLLVILIFIGIGAYITAGLLGLRLPGFRSGGSSSNAQPPVTTQRVNTTVTYAGVAITILSAQQSQSFSDDPDTTTTGMVRLHIQEQNKTTTRVSWIYNDIAHLILPGGKNLAPVFVQAKVGIAPGATQQSLLDFAVPTSMKISQLVLRLGAANEAQMDIPLTGHADLSKYALKTTNLNGQMIYLGLNWTLVSATSQQSIAGQQASKGMSYIIVTLKVDNTLSQEAIPGSAFDYMRLRSGSATASPKNTTLPVSFETGEMGKSGTVTFLMPRAAPPSP